MAKCLPDFRMYDPWITKNMRVADLLTHSSGLPEGGGDLMLWPEPNSFRRGRHLDGAAHRHATMAKVVAPGDFSSDHEDLHSVRTGNCP